MKIVPGIITVIVIVLIYEFVQEKYIRSLSNVNSGSRTWHVVGSYPNKTGAAMKLSVANTSMINFMRYLKAKYHIDETDDVINTEGDEHNKYINAPNDIYNIVNHLLDNYNPEVFYENDPRYSKDTSYTISKGASMYICLRDKSNPLILVDDNTLLFVLLHEASHIANYNGWGHDIHFWEVFKFILHEAVLCGVYKPVNYDVNPVMMCGLLINYQPLYDNDLRDLWI